MSRAEPALWLDDDAVSTVLKWQRIAGVQEVCALCAVDELGRQRLLQLTNHSVLADAIEVCRSEEELVRAAARQRGWKIFAFLHTHPRHAPEMSSRDALAFDRDTLPWIIVATSPPLRQRAYPRPVSSGGSFMSDAENDAWRSTGL